MIDYWFKLPSADWAGNLLGLSLAVISAAAAIYSSAVLPWIAELERATRGTRDKDGRPLDPLSTSGLRARDELEAVRTRDPRATLGRLSLAIAAPMTALGVIAGLQIPDSGLIYTVVPVLAAAGVAVGAAFLPGREARTKADKAITGLRPSPPSGAGRGPRD